MKSTKQPLCMAVVAALFFAVLLPCALADPQSPPKVPPPPFPGGGKDKASAQAIVVQTTPGGSVFIYSDYDGTPLDTSGSVWLIDLPVTDASNESIMLQGVAMILTPLCEGKVILIQPIESMGEPTDNADTDELPPMNIMSAPPPPPDPPGRPVIPPPPYPGGGKERLN